MFWSLDEGCSISYGTRSVQKNVFTFGPDSQCALWLVPSSHSPLCSFFHLENDISKESRINSTYFLAQPLKACKQMLKTGAYSSLQNYGFILTFPSKSENINVATSRDSSHFFHRLVTFRPSRGNPSLMFHSPFSCFPTLCDFICGTVYYKLMLLFGNQK